MAPTGLPPTARTASIQQQPELVFGNLVDRLQQDGFKVTHLDEQAGDVVSNTRATRSPMSIAAGSSPIGRTSSSGSPAASGSATFDRKVDKRLVELDRELELDSRMVISLRQDGSGTLISPTAIYVLTKTVDMAPPGGSVRGRTHETISFATGGTGAFSKGTVCQPNGRLERVVLDSLPAVSVVASAPPAADRRTDRALPR